MKIICHCAPIFLLIKRRNCFGTSTRTSVFQQYDREHQTQYIQTLMAYFSCGRNMTRTSNALFIHKTTLFYRFERMEKLVGPFLQQPKRLFLYEYSLHLLHEITPYPGV